MDVILDFIFPNPFWFSSSLLSSNQQQAHYEAFTTKSQLKLYLQYVVYIYYIL